MMLRLDAQRHRQSVCVLGSRIKGLARNTPGVCQLTVRVFGLGLGASHVNHHLEANISKNAWKAGPRSFAAVAVQWKQMRSCIPAIAQESEQVYADVRRVMRVSGLESM